MSLSITGAVERIFDEITGQGSNGTWVKQEFTIETVGEYPKTVHFSAWGDRTRTVKNLSEGETIEVFFEPSSREYNERWYTELRAWKIKSDVKANPEPNYPPAPKVEPETQFTPPNGEEEDDLPF